MHQLVSNIPSLDRGGPMDTENFIRLRLTGRLTQDGCIGKQGQRSLIESTGT